MAIRAAADPSGQLALDANALASLKAQAKTAPGEALGKAAGQFEALFLQMLLKQMRDALPQDGPLSSEATRNYTAMFDQQLAQQLSNQGLGLKKIIEKQLTRHLAVQADAASSAVTPKSPLAPSRTPASGAVPAPATGSVPAATSSLPAGVQAFIDKLKPHAEAVAKAMGVPAHYLLAQAGLETGWGRSLPKASDGSTSHNLFGIKAGANWKGAVVEAPTTEYTSGRAVHTVERFRAYASFTEAFQDFAKLLRGSPRYAGALAQAQDPGAYANGLQRAGYATDPHYGAKLTRAIQTVARHAGSGDLDKVQVTAGGADKKAIAA